VLGLKLGLGTQVLVNNTDNYAAESFHTKTVSKTHAVLENFRGV